MRARSAVLILIFVVCYAQQDPPVAVRKAFEAHDASLQWFSVVATRPVDANWEVVLAEAAPLESDGVRPPAANMQGMQLGVFLVSRASHQVKMVIDISHWSPDAYPELDEVDAHSVRLHSTGDYGDYQESVRYFYDSSRPRPTVTIRYRTASLQSARHENGKLIYTAEYGFGGEQFGIKPQRATITINTEGTRGAAPTFVIADDHTPMSQATKTARYQATKTARFQAAGQTFVVEAESQPSGIRLAGVPGKEQFFPAPVTHIGPPAFDGRRIWFARRFLDGDGYSGAGAIGAFDSVSHQYKIYNLPEIGTASGTAILADGNQIWVGLEGREEDSGHSAGLLRYNRLTGTVRKYNVNDVIHTINRANATIYCGTSDGLYTIQGDLVRHYRFEPDATGKLTMVARPAPFHPIAESQK